MTFSCQQRFVGEHVHENVPTFKGGNHKTHEEMSTVVIFICQGYKPLELTGYRIIWLKISGMPLGKKSWSEYFFLLSKPARTIPRFQVNQWKGNLSPFTILLFFNCFFAPKDKVNSFISIVKDCPLHRTGVAFQMLHRCFIFATVANTSSWWCRPFKEASTVAMVTFHVSSLLDGCVFYTRALRWMSSCKLIDRLPCLTRRLKETLLQIGSQSTKIFSQL